MRAKIFMAAIACVGLAGCDDASTPPATTATVQPPCNCQTASAPEAPVAPTRVSHHRAHHRVSYAERRYDEREADASYHSQSRTYYQGDSYQSDSDQSDSGDQGPPPDYRDTQNDSGGAESRYAVWVDGYGRRHYMAVASAAPVVSTPPDDRIRRHPWHGYDAKCDDKDK